MSTVPLWGGAITFSPSPSDCTSHPHDCGPGSNPQPNPEKPGPLPSGTSGTFSLHPGVPLISSSPFPGPTLSLPLSPLFPFQVPGISRLKASDPNLLRPPLSPVPVQYLFSSSLFKRSLDPHRVCLCLCLLGGGGWRVLMGFVPPERNKLGGWRLASCWRGGIERGLES